MTALPSHLTQSTWGEKCALYLDSFNTSHIPVPRLYTLRLAPAFSEIKSYVYSLGCALGLEQNSLIAEQNLDNTTCAVLFTTALVLLVTTVIIVMSSWRNIFRRTPTYDPVPGPHVGDHDYSYITRDVVNAPAAHAGPGPGQPGSADAAPDIILLKHHKYKHALEFPAYVIDDGALTVGHLRYRAAEVTGAPDPSHIKLLYKGKLLDEDSVPCKVEGMKQESEVLCVVSEVQPGSSDPEMDVDQVIGDGGNGDGGDGGQKSGSKRNKKRGGKSKDRKKNKTAVEPILQPPPPQPQQQQQPPKPTISTGSSSLPAPAPNLKDFKTPMEQVNALSAYIQSELLPSCDAYIASPPTDSKALEFEYRKLSETILAQVILKADGIDATGNPEARNARKALVNGAQEMLKKLDQVPRS